MKSLSILALAAVVMSGVVSSFAVAADAPAAVKASTLSDMGFGGMEIMSDEAGTKVRGKGTFAGVWGSSSAQFRGQSSANNYEAGASWVHKPSFAKGSSMSFAGKLQANFSADPTGSALSVQVFGGFAGGGASAFAH